MAWAAFGVASGDLLENAAMPLKRPRLGTGSPQRNSALLCQPLDETVVERRVDWIARDRRQPVVERDIRPLEALGIAARGVEGAAKPRDVLVRAAERGTPGDPHLEHQPRVLEVLEPARLGPGNSARRRQAR
jgi:hypothetical protein